MTVVAMSTLELEPIAGTIYEHRRKRCEIIYIFAFIFARTGRYFFVLGSLSREVGLRLHNKQGV